MGLDEMLIGFLNVSNSDVKRGFKSSFANDEDDSEYINHEYDREEDDAYDNG